MKVPVNPVVVATRLGARLSHAVFSEPKFSGMTARRNGAVTILVKEGDSPLRKRFTVAHEIGHMLLHLGSGTEEIIDTDADFFRFSEVAETAWSALRQREFDANTFAAELLMPRPLMEQTWQAIPAHDRTVDVMAKVFQVSAESMGYRLSEIGLANG